MDKKALKSTAVITLSFFAFLFIITLSNGAVQIHQFAIHQNVIKANSVLVINNSFQIINQSIIYDQPSTVATNSLMTTNLTLAKNRFYYSLSIGIASIINSYEQPITDIWYNNSNLKTNFNTDEYFYHSVYDGGNLYTSTANAFTNNTFINSLAQKNNNNFASLNGNQLLTFFIGTNLSFENLSNIAKFGSTFVVLPIIKGQWFIFDQYTTSITYPTTYFNCVYNKSIGNAYVLSSFAICYAKITATANISGLTSSDLSGLIQIPSSYSFTSEFSYISPSGQIPACSLLYPLEPVLSINSQSATITPLLNNYSFNEQPFTNNQFNYINSFQQLFTSNSSLSTPLVYQSLNPSQITTQSYPISIQNSFKLNNTYIEVSKNQTYTMSLNNASVVAPLVYRPAFFSDGQTITIGRATPTTPLTPTLFYTLFNSSLFFGANLHTNTTNTAIIDSYLISATNSTTYQNITLNLTMDIPLKDLTNSTLAIAPSVFNITQFLYYPALQSVNPNGSMLRISKVYPTILKPTFKIYTYANSSNQFLQLSMPQILTIEENTTGYTNTNLSVFFMVNALANLQFKYTLKNNTFTFSTFNPTPFNATFNSTNPTIVNPSNTEIYNETYVNSSTIPSLFWSYGLVGKVPVQISSEVNNVTFTPATKFNIGNKNYTSPANSFDLSLNASTIYNGLAYFIYNNKAKVVKFSFTTASFNPCLTTQSLTKVNIATTIYVNGSTTTITKSNNKTTSNSSSTTTPTTPTTPTSIFTPQQTFFGISFLNLGSFSWLATLGLYYLIGTFSVFLYIASKYKRTSQTLISYIVLGVLLVIGFGLGYVQSYIFALFMLILLVVVADTFRTLLTTRKG
jgi:hypothetical protein